MSRRTACGRSAARAQYIYMIRALYIYTIYPAWWRKSGSSWLSVLRAANNDDDAPSPPRGGGDGGA